MRSVILLCVGKMVLLVLIAKFLLLMALSNAVYEVLYLHPFKILNNARDNVNDNVFMLISWFFYELLPTTCGMVPYNRKTIALFF